MASKHTKNHGQVKNSAHKLKQNEAQTNYRKQSWGIGSIFRYKGTGS